MKRNYTQLFTKIRPIIKLYDETLIEELNHLAFYWMPEAFYINLNNWILENIGRDPENDFAIRIYSEITTHSYEEIKEAFIYDLENKKTK